MGVFNVTFNTNNAASRAITLSTGTVLTVSGTLLMDNTLAGVMSINTGVLVAQGNVTSDSTVGGTAAMTLTGGNPQVLTLGKIPTGTLTVNKSADTATLAAPLLANGSGQKLTLTAGILDLAGFNATVAGAFTVSSGATLKLQGGETVTRGSLVLSAGSTVEYNGSGAYASLPLGNSYQHVSFAGTGSWRHGGILDVNGNLSISNGTLNSNGQNITLAGNWIRSGGDYISGANTLILDGGSQTIFGDNTFNHLSKSGTAATTLRFENSKTQTLNGTLTLKGLSGNLLPLRSDLLGIQWQIDPRGGRNILYVNVQDSNNLSSVAVDASNTSVDAGNNTGWIFSGLVWSGLGANNNWSTSGNWMGAVVPGSTDTAIFNSFGKKNCTLNGSLTVKRLELVSGYSGVLSQAPGTVFTAGSMSCNGTFRLGANGKLVLLDSGEPLDGGGPVDATTNPPNTIEYRGADDVKLAAGAPVTAYHHLTLQQPVGLSRSDVLRAIPGEYDFDSAAIDTANGYAYFAASLSTPSRVAKVRLSDFTEVATLTLAAGETMPGASFINGGFLYIAMRTSPGRIVKIRLSDFTRVAALALNTGENNPISAVCDTAGGMAYFGTRTFPGRIVKVRLSDFTRVSALSLAAGQDELVSCAMDSGAGYAYFGTHATPGQVLKLRLSDFTIASTLTLPAGEVLLHSAVIDPAHGHVYFGTATSPGKVVKIRLSDFTRVAALSMNAGEDELLSAVIDPDQGYAYFGTNTNVGMITKIDLNTFTRVQAIALGNNEFNLYLSAVIDPAAGFAYFPTDAWVGTVAKVNLSYRSAEWSHASGINIGGNLSIGNGQFQSQGHDLTLAGNWNNSGTYVPGLNTVTLNGGDQTISGYGYNAFHHLTKMSSSGATLTFDSGIAHALTGKLNLQGVAGNLLKLRASQAGWAWKLDAAVSQVIQYVDVKDTDASAGAPVVALRSVDSGDNQNVIFSAPAQVTVTTSSASITSPAWVEGSTSGDVTVMSVSATGGLPTSAVRLSTSRWFMDNSVVNGSTALGITLSTGSTTHVEVTASNDFGDLNTVAQDLVWTPTDMAGKSASTTMVKIRKGDSLLLTATGPGLSLSIDADGDGTTDVTGAPGQSFPYQYSVPGTFVASAKIDGVDAGSVTVVVMYADLTKPIACQVGYQREKDVVITPAAQASSILFGINDPKLLSTSIKGPFNTVDGQGTTIYLKAQRRGTPILTARLGDATGPIVAYKAVDEFTRDIPALWSIMVNDSTDVGGTTVTLRPYIPNLQFKFDMFASTSSFAGGGASIVVNTSDVDPATGQPVFKQVFDGATGETVGEYSFEIEVPDGENKYCYNMSTLQSSSAVKSVASVQAVNGSVCKAIIFPIVICQGESETLTIFRTESLTDDGHKHDVKLSGIPGDGPRFANPLSPSGTIAGDGKTIIEWFDCDWLGTSVYTATVSARSTGYFDLTPAGKYSISIGGANFYDVVTVVKVDHIKWKDNNVEGTTIAVRLGSIVTLTAISDPVNVWPAGHPTWTGATGNGATATVDTAMLGSKVVTVACGTSSKTVTVNVLKVSVVPDNVFVDYPNPLTLTATVTPGEVTGATYKWFVLRNGIVQPDPGNTSTVTFTEPGRYFGAVTYQTKDGNVDSNIVDDTIRPTVGLSVDPAPANPTPQIILVGETAKLTATGNPAGVGGVYTWTGATTSTEEHATFTGNAVGSYPITVIYKLNEVESAAATVTITVKALTVAITSATPQPALVGEIVTLTAVGDPSGGEYIWTNADGNSSTATVTSEYKGGIVVSVTYSLRGQYATAQIIVVFEDIAVTLSANPIIIPSGGTSKLIAEGTPSGGSYTWFPSFFITPGTGGNATCSATVPGTYVVTVTYTLRGYTATATVTVKVVAKLVSKTIKPAPDGMTKDDRKEIGVCEEVTISTDPPTEVIWTVKTVKGKNGIVFPSVGDKTVFSASDIKSDSEVSASIGGVTIGTITFNVIPPSGMTYRKIENFGYYSKGHAGAGMLVEFTLMPLTVCFGNIGMKEISKDAIDDTGRYKGNAPPHETNPDGIFVRVNDMNIYQPDICQTPSILPDHIGPPPSWDAGSFTWPIPNHYAKWGATAEDEGYLYFSSKQIFNIATDGTYTITKGAASCERHPITGYK